MQMILVSTLPFLLVAAAPSSSQAVAWTENSFAITYWLGETVAFTADPRDFQFSPYL